MPTTTLTTTIRDALFAVVLLSIIVHYYDRVHHHTSSQYLEALQRMHIDDDPVIQDRMNTSSRENGDDYDFTIFMLSKDRHEYEQTIPEFLERMTHYSLKIYSKQFILFDMESKQPLKLPDSLKQYEESGLLKLIRKQPGNTTREFSFWESYAFAMNHITSRYIFYFDNCNRPDHRFYILDYLRNRHHGSSSKPKNYYFPNDERWFTSSFAANRKDFVKFLRELPVHISMDKRSFFGGDQLMIWYLDSEREFSFTHIPHPGLAEYNHMHGHSVIAFRLFLYMNRYGHPLGESGVGNVRPDFCKSKQFLCVQNGLIRRVFKLWGVYHMLDTLFRFEIMFLPMVVVYNWTSSWVLSFTSMLVTNTLAFVVLRKGIRQLDAKAKSIFFRSK